MTVYTDVVCPFCGCLCDDLEITVEENKILSTKAACAISRAKFINHSENKIVSPTISGNIVTIEEAIEEADFDKLQKMELYGSIFY